MKNYEKYAEEIKSYKGENFCQEFVLLRVHKGGNCLSSCEQCRMLQLIWLLEEYEEPKEPEVDWSKVEVDTPILVRQSEDYEWLRRYFAKYENGKVYAWLGEETSETIDLTMAWKLARLVETEDAE